MTLLSLDSIAVPDLHPQAPLGTRKARLSDIDVLVTDAAPDAALAAALSDAEVEVWVA